MLFLQRLRIWVLGYLCFTGHTCALQNLFRQDWKSLGSSNGATRSSRPSAKIRALEDALLNGITDRLSNSDGLNQLITQLESSPSISEPAIAPELYGKWRLVYTTSTTSASPIQRSAVNAEKFPIYQDIVVIKSKATGNGDASTSPDSLLVQQIVKFGPDKMLSVDAVASTTAYPLEDLTERVTTGKVLGLNILGVSLTGSEAAADPNRPNSRVDFRFDEGNFQFGNTKIPYPVPFRLPILRDWVKGWIDITYLSDRLRISRGNKGTTFVLVKENEP